MRIIALFAALSLSACMQSNIAPAQSPAAQAPLPPIGAECTGPSRKNFNGAKLTQAIVSQMPQQFAADRDAMRRALAGSADAETERFLKLCHGLTL